MHVESFTEPPEVLAGIREWQVRKDAGARTAYTVIRCRAQGRGFVAEFAGVETREAAAKLTGAWLDVERDTLPPIGEREHYRVDLIGLAVRNLDGVELGCVAHFVDGPANAAMVVRGEREHWLPVTPRHVVKVDREAGVIVVDWPADF